MLKLINIINLFFNIFKKKLYIISIYMCQTILLQFLYMIRSNKILNYLLVIIIYIYYSYYFFFKKKKIQNIMNILKIYKYIAIGASDTDVNDAFRDPTFT